MVKIEKKIYTNEIHCYDIEKIVEKYSFSLYSNNSKVQKSGYSIEYFDISTCKEDIYKTRIVSEYNFESDINIVTDLDFYSNYKKNLLGSKDKKEKINKFEKFLSNYFFNGANLSIIPDEETFELKI